MPFIRNKNRNRHASKAADLSRRHYLPLYNGVKSVELGVPKGRTLTKAKPPAKPRPSIVFYGTSITQGGCASRPGMAFTAIAGRKLDATVVNLGFSGSGRMEMAWAALLAELDPSVYVLDTMTNMSAPQVSERVAPFVKALRKARPSTPIVFVEDASLKGLHPTERGRILETAVAQLYVLSNQGLLGDDTEGTVDGCHPNDLGMMRHADAIAKGLRTLVFERSK
jgi:lysophospholipase L1-like esterase